MKWRDHDGLAAGHGGLPACPAGRRPPSADFAIGIGGAWLQQDPTVQHVWSGLQQGVHRSCRRYTEKYQRQRVEPDRVTLDEVCLGQYNYLVNRLEGAGWSLQFLASLPAVGDCAGLSFGNAVLWRDGYSATFFRTYTNQKLKADGTPVAERRNYICGQSPYNVLVCSTHLVANAGEIANRQLGELRSFLDNRRSNESGGGGLGYVVAGGDLNLSPFYAPSNSSDPNELNNMYLGYDEADGGRDRTTYQDTTDGTAGFAAKKYDYIFAAKYFMFFSEDARVYGAPHSDHKLYEGYPVFANNRPTRAVP